MDKRDPLYEYCLLISLQEVEVTVKPALRKRTAGDGKAAAATVGPTTKKGFQPIVERFHPKPPSVGSIPVFCFPDANSLTEDTVRNKKHAAHHASFCVLLTEQDGQKHFCFCLRTLTAADGLPRSLCVVTQRGWFHFFPQLLRRLERVFEQEGFDRVCTVLNQGIDSQQLLLVGSCQFPELVRLTASGGQATEKRPFQAPDAATLADGHPLADVSPLPLFKRLFVSHILILFAALLNERRVLCFSHSYTRLSDCLFAALAAIRPFAWQHMFIPVLPGRLLDYVAAPFPFLIGVHSSLRTQVQRLPLDDVLLVDLDKNFVELGAENDVKTLPKKHAQTLRNSLDRAVRAARSTRSLKRQALQAPFELFFADILRNFHRFFRAPSVGPLALDAHAAAHATGSATGASGLASSTSSDNNGHQPMPSPPPSDQQQQPPPTDSRFRWTYDLRAFLRSQSSRARRAFLRLLCQSQLWEQFVAERLDLLAAAGPALAHPSLLAAHSAWDAALLARDALESGTATAGISSSAALSLASSFSAGGAGSESVGGSGAAFVASASAVMADAGHRLLRSWQRLAEKPAAATGATPTSESASASAAADESRKVDRLKAGMARAAKTLRSGPQLSPQLANRRLKKTAAPHGGHRPAQSIASGRSFFDEIKADFGSSAGGSGSETAVSANADGNTSADDDGDHLSSLSDESADNDDDHDLVVPLEEAEEDLPESGRRVNLTTASVAIDDDDDDDDDDEILSAETKALEEAADQAASVAAQQHRLRRQREQQQALESWSPSASDSRGPDRPTARRASTAYNALLTVANETGKELDFLSSPGSVLTSKGQQQQQQQQQQLDLIGLSDFSSNSGEGGDHINQLSPVQPPPDSNLDLLQALQPFARKRVGSVTSGSPGISTPFNPFSPTSVPANDDFASLFSSPTTSFPAATNGADGDVQSSLPFDDNVFAAGPVTASPSSESGTRNDIESLFAPPANTATAPTRTDDGQSKETLLDLM